MRDNTTIKALRALSRRELDLAKFGEFLAEINSGSDRAVAVVWGSLVEDALRHQLTVGMEHLTSDEKKNLFAATGPVDTFGGKVIVAHGMNLISREEERKLSIIKEIRNAFAHAFTPLTFDTPEVAAACALLLPDSVDLKARGLKNRGIYSWACFDLFQHLYELNGAFIQHSDGSTYSLGNRFSGEPATSPETPLPE